MVFTPWIIFFNTKLMIFLCTPCHEKVWSQIPCHVDAWPMSRWRVTVYIIMYIWHGNGHVWLDRLAKNPLQLYRESSSINMITMITFLESAHRNTRIYWRKLKSNTYLKYSLKIVYLCSLISPTQRPKNRDFRINTIFYMIFWKLEMILMQSDQEERSSIP